MSVFSHKCIRIVGNHLYYHKRLLILDISSLNGYWYGFNGQERDYEINADGNVNTAEFWMYDGRLGRRWNVDPKPSFSISVYAIFSNNSIWFNDVRGILLLDLIVSEFILTW